MLRAISVFLFNAVVSLFPLVPVVLSSPLSTFESLMSSNFVLPSVVLAPVILSSVAS